MRITALGTGMPNQSPSNVAASFLVELGNGDAFITLFNSDTNNNGAILDFRIRDDSFGVRNPAATDTSTLPHALDDWMDVLVTWEYPGGDTTQLPQVIISVDGVR